MRANARPARGAGQSSVFHNLLVVGRRRRPIDGLSISQTDPTERSGAGSRACPPRSASDQGKRRTAQFARYPGGLGIIQGLVPVLFQRPTAHLAFDGRQQTGSNRRS